ncbi:hypothetical protein F511_31474 [Dorcoceras hygrometricum]|uniref:DUF4378 domain-containing protein n=1 Tax=Dorcoceras hygrometricum TaxID=472368 RepID=A0A2Z7BTD6_9LAMI|nr:hypothetical protein F511_31474 [Dorcoceras hygrometricum]
MAKRSKKRPTRHKKDAQTGCMWGLISLLDFRQGRSTRRLLSDRVRVCEQSVGAEHSSIKTTLQSPTEKCPDAVVEAEESTMPMFDVVKPSVKELMEEEMVSEQGLKNRLNDSEMCLDQLDFRYGQPKKKNPKRRNRICNNSSDIDTSELGIKKYLVTGNFEEVPEQKTANTLDLEMIMEELAKINQRNANHKKPIFNGDLEVPCDHAAGIVEEEIVSAIKLFIEQRVSSDGKHIGEEGKSFCSREFADAVQTLSTNKRIVLKLLKDPNSVLVKYIQNLDNSQIESGSRLPEEKPIKLKSDEFSSHKHGNFFRRKSTSLESDLSGRDKTGQSSSKIVILKPGLVRSPEMGDDVSGISFQSNYMDKKGPIVRNPSQFSFHEIKRKLRHAMGKEKQGISLDGLVVKLSNKHRNGNSGEKGVSGENFSWSSPNRNHFYTEKFTKSSSSFKKGEQTGNLKAKGSAMVDETCQYQRLGVSNIYIEAKKHLSEILNNEDENSESMTEQLHKSLGRILSFPDYNSSPCCSPGKHGDGIVTAHMRLSPNGIVTDGHLQENNNNYPSSSMPNLDSQHCMSVSTSDDKVESLGMNVVVGVSDDQECCLENESVIGGTIINDVSNSSSRIVEIEEKPESMLYEDNVFTVSFESISNSIGGDIQNVHFKEREDREEGTKNLEDSSCRFKSDFVAEDHILSSPTVSPTLSPVSPEVEISDCVHEKMERPSPISVLESLFPDDDISPASTKSQIVEKDIPPLHIHFEEQSPASDQGICVRISLEDEESAFEYVEAVLLGSGLNWDEYLSRWVSSYEILDLSLFNEVELFSSRPRHDQKLLFDCANEALEEVCDRYFGCFSGISNRKQNIRPVAKGMDLIHEVWRVVEWHMYEHQPPRCLEQLVERDMARPGKWMNLQSDLEVICFEMWESIFDDLVEDVVLSCGNDASEQPCEV